MQLPVVCPRRLCKRRDVNTTEFPSPAPDRVASVRALCVAVDTGGTFTDLVAVLVDGTRRHLKTPSTPDDPSQAILTGLSALGLAPADVEALHHGTTVATNALLERRGARVVLVATAGFEDVLALARQARPDLYALHPEAAAPLVAREDVLGHKGRLDADGTILADDSDFAARNLARLADAEAFAVCTLHGHAHPVHEAALAAALTAAFPDRPCAVSHRTAPVMREYERTSTVVVDAYVAPVIARYLSRLSTACGPDLALRIMGSAGGLLSPEAAIAAPVRTVLSGPAGGVRGAWAVGRRLGLPGLDGLLAVDMGGTSTDVSVIHGDLLPEDEGALGSHPLRVPVLPIETVGAGGGSVAFLDAGGALRVGPRSAGARPGPACYGRGGVEPTVTDAHVVLGHLTTLLGGAMPLDVVAARSAVDRVATPLGLSLEAAAQAICDTVSATMARACRRVSSSRGHDPRGLALLAFGGAAGLEACALAEELGCRAVIFPAEPGLLSAEGMLNAPLAADVTAPLGWVEATWSAARATEVAGRLGDAVRAALPAEIDVTYLADLRYRGQTHALAVPLTAAQVADVGALRRVFEAIHQRRFGHVFGSERPVEWVALRCLGRSPTGAGWAHMQGAGAMETEACPGPTLVSAYSATLRVPAGWTWRRMPTGDVLCERLAEGHAGTTAAQGLEIHRQRLAAIAEEMGETLMRAAFSANIKERRDFSCALFDADGQMIEHAAHIPVHLGSTPLSVAAARAAVAFEPGMQALLNDPFAGGTHLPDVTLVTPVFAPGHGPGADDERKPAFFVANRAHHADVGGIAAGSLPAPQGPDGTCRALTIDDEGVRIPPVALTDNVRRRFEAASRVPDDRRGDLAAQESANLVGVRALAELVARCGLPALNRWNAELLDYAERRMRAVLSALPAGEVSFTDHLDDDGMGLGLSIPLPVMIRLAGGGAEFDFRGAPDQVAGPMNAVRAIVVSAVFYVLKCLAGDEMPANAGLLRPVRILTRPGSIVDALPPAAVSSGNVETSQRLVDTLFGALALLAPDRIPAASGGSMNNVIFGGTNADGAPFVHYETLGGGAGASARGPGLSGRHTHMTNTLNTPVEALEQAFPVRIEAYALRSDDRGEPPPGEHAGGRGVRRIYRFLRPAEVTVISERRRLAPWGVGGARPGQRGRNALLRADGTEEDLPGKFTRRFEAGEALIVETPGGGGHRARPPA